MKTNGGKYDSSKLALGVLLFIFISYPFMFGFPAQIIGWDAFGYYLYLPQTFIENDIALKDLTPVNNAIETYKFTPTLYQVHPLENGNHVIQYTCGLAVLYGFFFIIGHLVALTTDYTADGYSAPYGVMMLIGSYTYMIVGLFYLRKVLLHFYSARITAVTLILVGLGTNYYAIHTLSHGMPHVYLFTLYTLLIWRTIKWHEKPSLKYAIYLGIILGLMALARPTEILAILIPLLYGVNSWSSFKDKLVDLFTLKRSAVLFILLPIFLIGSLQLLYWKMVTGSFLYNSYANPGEGMEFLHPHTLDFLFSFRKGWFIYTPIILLAGIGLFRLQSDIRKNWLLALVLFTVLNIYVSSSWSNWWYATSFGQRTMVQSYVIVAIGLGGLFYRPYKGAFIGRFFAVLAILFLSLNLFQSWQYKNGIIHPDRMTCDAYFACFGSTEIPEGFNELLLVDRNLDNVIWSKYERIQEIHFENGGIIDFSDEYGPILEVAYNNITDQDHALIQTQIAIEGNTSEQIAGLLLVQTFMHDGGNYGYKVDEFEAGNTTINGGFVWLKSNYITPEVRVKSDKFRTFIWNPDEKEVKFKAFSITIFEKK